MANKFPYIGRGNQRLIHPATPAAYNVDNGAGATVDYQLGNFPFDCYLVDVRAVDRKSVV